MPREDKTSRTERPKREREPDREGQRRGGQEAEKQSRDWPADKDTNPVRQGEKRK